MICALLRRTNQMSMVFCNIRGNFFNSCLMILNNNKINNNKINIKFESKGIRDQTINRVRIMIKRKYKGIHPSKTFLAAKLPILR